MNLTSKILVVDANDMIGDAITRSLRRSGYKNLLLPAKDELDLMDREAVFAYYAENKPEYVFMFAGPHGGIIANVTYPADFIYQNLTIQNNLIHGAYLCGVKKMLFMVGNCAYPKVCPQPIKEEYFQTGVMEQTSVAYSMARCAGVEMCLAYNRQYKTDFVPSVFGNYFGINDDYTENGHVLASIMRKIYQAKKRGDQELVLWGTGEPLRQFLYIDDLADGAVCIMNKIQKPELINIAGGCEKSICEIAEILKKTIGYNGTIVFDSSKPNGTMRKFLDNSKLKSLGWKEKMGFDEGLKISYQWFLDHIAPTLD